MKRISSTVALLLVLSFLLIPPLHAQSKHPNGLKGDSPVKTFRGQGLDTISLTRYGDPFIIRINVSGNSGEFASVSGNPKSGGNELIPLFSAVSFTLPFFYTDIINYFPKGRIDKLNVMAPGAWTIELLPLSAAPVLSASKAITGTDDQVVKFDSSIPAVLTIENANPGDSYFVVESFGQRRRSIMQSEYATQQKIQIDLPIDYLVVHSPQDVSWKVSVSN